MKKTRHPRYARHRYPAEVISHAVWLYFRFPLSLRMVEEMGPDQELLSMTRLGRTDWQPFTPRLQD
jgi:transposase-like protein